MQPCLVQWWHIDNLCGEKQRCNNIHNESKLSVNDSWSIWTLLLTYRFGSCTILKHITMESCYGSLLVPSYRYINDDIYVFYVTLTNKHTLSSIRYKWLQESTVASISSLIHLRRSAAPAGQWRCEICSALRPCPHACGYFYKHFFISAFRPQENRSLGHEKQSYWKTCSGA